MNDIENICNEIGRQTLVEELSVTKAAISNAISNGRFPPRWVSVVRHECDKKGIDCPDELFGIIPASSKVAS